MPVIEIIYWLSLGVLYYLYDGYLRMLQLLVVFHRTNGHTNEQHFQTQLTVLVTVHNEAAQIRKKLANTLDAGFIHGQLQVLVASDGSIDGTDLLVTDYPDDRVQLFRPLMRGGKTATQNQAIQQACGNIIVFTDAATRFDNSFLREICAPFSDPDVGAVDGHLLFVREPGNPLSASQGYYWNYELRVRTLESRLGILAVASGACLAVRKSLLIPMDPAIGEDCIVPLDVIAQGKRVVHAQRALAYDSMDNSAEREFRTRVRMTARNWRGTWARPELLNPLQHPGYAFTLWSHKLLRWLSPFFLIVLFLTALIIGLQSGGWLWCLMIIPGGVALGGVAAWVTMQLGVRIPGFGTVYSFCLANLGFLLGVLKAWFGRAILIYK